jgi:YjbE family integral membrane protein
MSLSTPEYWAALLQVIGLNCILSLDNAVAIALISRRLPADRQIRGLAWGCAASIGLRIGLTIAAVELLRLPYMRLIGAVLLLWIATQMLLPEPAAQGAETPALPSSRLTAAIKLIVLTDLAMSLDNVVAVAAAAKDSTSLLIAGLAVSIPLVVFASHLLLKMVSRYPVIVMIGAALVGWVAGELGIADPALQGWIGSDSACLYPAVPAFAALGVVWFGKSLAARELARRRTAAP